MRLQVGLAGKAVELLGYGNAVDGQGHGLGNGRESQERVRVAAVEVFGAICVAEGRVGVGLIECKMRSTVLAKAEATVPMPDASISASWSGSSWRFQAKSASPVTRTALGCRGRIAAAGEDDAVEIGGFATVVRVAFVGGLLVGGELDDAIGAAAEGVGVLFGAVACCRAYAVGELGGADDWGAGADEGGVGVRLGLGESNPEGQLVHDFQGGDVGECAAIEAAGVRVGAVLPGERDVPGGERAAVGPFEVFAEAPGDGHKVG